jgi:hypothetical protein
MHRRRYLALLSASLAGAAGCLSEARGPGAEPSDADPTATESPTTATPGDPAPGPGSDVTSGSEFPPNGDDADRVVWARDVDDPSGRVALEASYESTALPEARATFALHNRGDRTFATNFYDWRLYRHEGGRWFRVAPRYVNQPLMHLEPGQSHAWTLVLSDEVPDGGVAHPGGTEDLHVRPVGGGTYAFAVDGWFPDQTATPTHEHTVVHAARFDLDGPELSLEPSGAVESVTRSDGVVRIEAAGDGGEDARQATYVLRRAPDAADPTPVVTEQAYRRWPLRDALAHAGSDVEAVRLRARDGTHPPFGVHAEEPRAFTYDGTTWLETVETDDGAESS